MAMFATYFRDSETGLDYAQNRYYRPGEGRFMTPDPSGDSWNPSDPGSWNSYAYSLGDPIGLNDPTGLAPCGDLPLSSGRSLSDAALANTEQGHFIDLVWHEAGTLRQAAGDTAAWQAEFRFIAQGIWDRYRIVTGQERVVGANGFSYCGRSVSALGYGPTGRNASLTTVLIAAAAGTTVLDDQGKLSDMTGLQYDLNQEQGDVTKQSAGKVQLANGWWVTQGCASVVLAVQFADAVSNGYDFNPQGEFITSWNSSNPINNPNFKAGVEYLLGSAGPTNFYGFFTFATPTPRPVEPRTRRR